MLIEQVWNWIELAREESIGIKRDQSMITLFGRREGLGIDITLCSFF